MWFKFISKFSLNSYLCSKKEKLKQTNKRKWRRKRKWFCLFHDYSVQLASCEILCLKVLCLQGDEIGSLSGMWQIQTFCTYENKAFPTAIPQLNPCKLRFIGNDFMYWKKEKNEKNSFITCMFISISIFSYPLSQLSAFRFPQISALQILLFCFCFFLLLFCVSFQFYPFHSFTIKKKTIIENESTKMALTRSDDFSEETAEW